MQFIMQYPCFRLNDYIISVTKVVDLTRCSIEQADNYCSHK